MSEPLIAEIRLFAGNYAPRGWAFCQGQLLPIAENTALFSLLGTTWGGDGRTTFALPDLRGRVPVGTGHRPYHLGERGGVERASVYIQQMPSHEHGAQSSVTVGLKVSTDEGSEHEPPPGSYLAEGFFAGPNENHRTEAYVPASGASPSVKLDTFNSSQPQATIHNTGESYPHENMQPWLGVQYIIAMQGIYPTRH